MTDEEIVYLLAQTVLKRHLESSDGFCSVCAKFIGDGQTMSRKEFPCDAAELATQIGRLLK